MSAAKIGFISLSFVVASCCGCFVFMAAVGRNARVAPPGDTTQGSTATTTPTPVAPNPPVSPTAASLDLRRRLEGGEEVPVAECQAEARRVGGALKGPYEPWLWSLARCAWQGEAHDALALDIDRLATTMPEAPVDAEVARLVAAARAHLAANPGLIVALGNGALLRSEPGAVDRDLAALAALAERCPSCARVAAFRAAKRQLEARRAATPIAMPDLRSFKLAYADIRGRNVRLRGEVTADTYYNCKYRSQSQWRSFRLSEGLLDFGMMHVYCPRGDAWCDRLFAGSANGTDVDVIVRYPSSNSICEESQAELVEAIER